HGWNVHPPVSLPGGARAQAISIGIADALGWLVTLGGGMSGDGVGSSLKWLGRVVIAAVRLSARGRAVPTLDSARRPGGRALVLSVMSAAVDAILREAARKVEVAAPPPTVRTAADVTEAVITRLDGSPFEAPLGVGASAAKRLQSWGKPVSGVAVTRLVVQLE